MSTKNGLILRSRRLSNLKYNKSVKDGQKLASVCLESSVTAYKHHQLAIVATPIDRAHYALCMTVVSVHAHD